MRTRHLLLCVISGVVLLAGVAQAIPPERTLLSDDFDHYGFSGRPGGWLPLDGSWFIAQRSTKVLRQGNQDMTHDSWALAQWANYSVTVKCLADEGEGPWGIGFTAYQDPEGDCYRLRMGGAHLYLEKVRGSVVQVLADADAKTSRGKWYSLRLGLNDGPDGAVTLLGKVWSSDEDEPKNWALKVADAKRAYLGGSVGLWTGNCSGRFAFLSIKQYDATADKTGDVVYATDFSDTPQGQLPPFWVPEDGLWVKDNQDNLPVLRQMVQDTGPMYDDNARALFQWSGYTVTTRAIAHPGRGRWGMGVVAYYGANGSNYRLRTLDNRIYLAKRRPNGRIVNLVASTTPIKRGHWYNLKLAVDNFRNGTRLQGKIWEDGQTEPPDWQLVAFDRDHPLRCGMPGLWCFGTAVDFDNFLVKVSTLSTLNASISSVCP